VKVGDRIDIRFGEKEVSVEVQAIMDTTKKENAAEMYRYI
jgi:ribosomal 50S subunit-recycling heat shock protein